VTLASHAQRKLHACSMRHLSMVIPRICFARIRMQALVSVALLRFASVPMCARSMTSAPHLHTDRIGIDSVRLLCVASYCKPAEQNMLSSSVRLLASVVRPCVDQHASHSRPDRGPHSVQADLNRTDEEFFYTGQPGGSVICLFITVACLLTPHLVFPHLHWRVA